MPLAFIAVISRSADILPNAIRVDIRTAIGSVKATIHAMFKKKNSNITLMANPRLSKCPNRVNSKFRIHNKVIMKKPKKKGSGKKKRKQASKQNC